MSLDNLEYNLLVLGTAAHTTKMRSVFTVYSVQVKEKKEKVSFVSCKTNRFFSDPPVPLPRLAALLAVTGLVTVGQLVLAQVESSENSRKNPACNSISTSILSESCYHDFHT